jgi:hypothetical protein
MNVGVIRNIVITVRLEDLLCAGSQAIERYDSLVEAFWVPDRFLPDRGPANGREIAEAIALHQAASARHVSERLRLRLKPIGSPVQDSASQSAGEKDRRSTSERESIRQIRSTIDQLDRQLARLLRRFGPYGRPEEPEDEQLVPPEVKLRYRFALDEISSLRADARWATDAVEDRHRERVELALGIFAAIILAPALVVGLLRRQCQFPVG